MAVGDLVKRDEDPTGAVFAGIIASEPTDLGDLIEVIIPAFDTEKTWGPAPWMPRGDSMPAEGDRCVVAMAETDDEGTPDIWVIAWWEG